jgi:beta-lactamase class C
MQRSLWIFSALLATGLATQAAAQGDDTMAALIAQHIESARPKDGVGGVAVALRVGGSTVFYNVGKSDETNGHPVTSDTLFNLGSVGKIFDTAMIGQAVVRGEIAIDDPVAKYIPELATGGDIKAITFAQLASYTSGFVLPQDGPPWDGGPFTLPEFFAKLRSWKSDAKHLPGRQRYYSHSGYVLIHLALERRFGTPFHKLIAERILAPLGLRSTAMPEPVPETDMKAFPRGRIPDALRARAVQGYDFKGTPVGEPGDLQGFYHFLGSGQMYSSARDMAVFLAANLGELPNHSALQSGMKLARHGIFAMDRGLMQAMAWEVRPETPTIVDKFGGLNNASAYVGTMPDRNIGVVILANRGSLGIADAGRALLRAIAARNPTHQH